MSVEVSRPMRAVVDEATERRIRRASQRRWTWFGVVAVVMLAADQLTKVIVRASLAPGEQIGVFPGLGLVRARNEGIAFGLFPGKTGLVAALTVAALVAIAFALLRLARRSLVAALGGGLLIGGSVGNLVDRLIHGGVTDFIDVSAWPAFNVADMGIIAGAALVAFGLLRGQHGETG